MYTCICKYDVLYRRLCTLTYFKIPSKAKKVFVLHCAFFRFFNFMHSYVNIDLAIDSDPKCTVSPR